MSAQKACRATACAARSETRDRSCLRPRARAGRLVIPLRHAPLVADGTSRSCCPAHHAHHAAVERHPPDLEPTARHAEAGRIQRFDHRAIAQAQCGFDRGRRDTPDLRFRQQFRKKPRLFGARTRTVGPRAPSRVPVADGKTGAAWTGGARWTSPWPWRGTGRRATLRHRRDRRQAVRACQAMPTTRQDRGDNWRATRAPVHPAARVGLRTRRSGRCSLASRAPHACGLIGQFGRCAASQGSQASRGLGPPASLIHQAPKR